MKRSRDDIYAGNPSKRPARYAPASAVCSGGGGWPTVLAFGGSGLFCANDCLVACSGVARPIQGSQAGLSAAASRLTTGDALSYLRDVKVKFSDNKDVYDTFLEIMKKFKAQK